MLKYKISKKPSFLLLMQKLLVRFNLIAARLIRQEIPTIKAIYAHDTIGYVINAAGMYEKDALVDTFQFLMRFYPACLAGGSAVDAGANIGNHTLYFSKYYKKVFAFEPMPDTYDLLRVNTKEASNVEALNIGLSSHSHLAQLNICRNNMGASKISDSSRGASIEISCVSLDEVIPHDCLISLIKLDVEGHELEVLQGAESTIDKNRPIILFEANSDSIHGNTSTVFKYLGIKNYIFYAREDSLAPRAGALVRSLALIAFSILPHSVRFVKIERLEKHNYDMIIAIPGY